MSESFEDGGFDAIIDKACFDSVLAGDGSESNSEMYLKEIHRVTSCIGVYINISHAKESERMEYFKIKDNYDWADNFVVKKIAKPYTKISEVLHQGETDDSFNFHYMYIMRKKV